MNMFHALLFYIYSFAALIGLTSRWNTTLSKHPIERSAYPNHDDGRFQELINNAEAARQANIGATVQAAQEIGDLMASSATMSLVGSAQKAIIDQYKAALAYNEREARHQSPVSPEARGADTGES